jgi:hypothetical protein
MLDNDLVSTTDHDGLRGLEAGLDVDPHQGATALAGVRGLASGLRLSLTIRNVRKNQANITRLSSCPLSAL